MLRLKQSVADAGLDLLVVSAEESILCLTGVSYRPRERSFFISSRLASTQWRNSLLIPVQPHFV